MSNDQAPLSFEVKVTSVSSNPFEVHIDASEEECQALAQFWNIAAVKSLSAHVRLSRWKRDGVKLSGHFEGVLAQSCVVSLKLVETHIRDDFISHFVPDTSKLARQDDALNGELVIDVDGPDIPDTFSANVIDVGAVVAEFAAMAIDPYPRAANVEIDAKYQTDNAVQNEDKISPFAGLSALKDQMNGNDH